MTYWQFHLVFTLPLFCLLIWLSRNNPFARSQKSIRGMLLLLFLCLAYTTPWDSYLIREKIWTYQPDRVLGTLFLIPFEEYFFFVIQTIIGCCFTSLLLKVFDAPSNHSMKIGPRQMVSLVTSLGLVGLGLWLYSPSLPMRYLFLILFWSLPVLIMQWSLGLSILRKQRRVWLFSVLFLTFYFWFADSVAIAQQIWIFPSGTISGWKLFGVLPVEEAVFFLATNLMVVQGYLLFTTVDFSKFQFSLRSGAHS